MDDTTVEDMFWIRTVTIGTAKRDQTMKKGLPMLEFGEKSPYLLPVSQTSVKWAGKGGLPTQWSEVIQS